MSASATPSVNHDNPQAAPPPGPGTGRDSAGRFTAGNKYGPGNPFARQTAELRKVLLEVVSPEEMRQVAFTLLLLAKAGKLGATKLLFQYVLGKPAQAVDPDRLDVEEWKLAQESKVNPVAVHETVDHLPAEVANVLVRHAWPASTEANLRVVRDELAAMDREDAERARAAQEQAPAEANGDVGAAGQLPEEGKVPAPAEANGDDGGPPRPQPPSPVGRGGEEERGGGAAREGGPPSRKRRGGAPRQTAVTAGGPGPARRQQTAGTATPGDGARRRAADADGG